MPDDSKRRKSIDSAVEGADPTPKKKPVPKGKNPYPKGSARHKLWNRRNAQSTDSSQ